ncbi:MAG: hypothetical protein KJ852_13940 [Gammaproteobacteria bacterium]|nr:hypothetical protein [Gammaproteobacteria bacterium]MBU0788438.1 hypothetical protein [Gammaproteobacteria bacterium]MBU0816416.1 hypothetical protein [Gammaproteobacteria bacterium]MBU1788053.1 hypothetical protein [Gammaproteobacteria bacterium]
MPNLLESAESEIDASFADNAVALVPFGQSVWTLLSVAEDYHFKAFVHSPLSDPRATMYVDSLMNELTYPLRVCHRLSPKDSIEIDRRMNEELYRSAHEWIEKAGSYVNFSSIFPLYHAKQIELKIVGNTLVPSDWRLGELSYEVYDRFVAKRDPERGADFDQERLVGELASHTNHSGDAFSVRFDQRLVQLLRVTFGTQMMARHILPSDWQFAGFSLQEYRDVFTCLQSLAYGWFLARQLAVHKGVAHYGFKSSVWTPRKGALVMTLSRGTGHAKEKVSEILSYMTFGEVGVRHPDVAIQPIFDLLNGQYAISPFLLVHTNGERNLCVLLNQVPKERALYARLVDEKEEMARIQIIHTLADMNLDFRHGRIGETDVDLAIIDRAAKICLCVEIKWFIEPAEIREVLARSEEIKKGVGQAVKIRAAFDRRDDTLFELLDIDETYDFLAMVGSENSIGNHSVQDPRVPVTKLWHLASEIRRTGGVGPVLAWLRSRAYLPQEGRDYRILQIPIEIGKWRSTWYGIDYLHEEPGWVLPESMEASVAPSN